MYLFKLQLVFCFIISVAICFEISSDSSSPGSWSSKIIGGNTANLGQFPFQVSLRRTRNTTIHICGGSIINKNWIITAGHCLLYFNSTKEALIVVGIIDLHQPEATNYNIQRYVIHPKFDKSLKKNDLGLMQTTISIIFNQNVKAIQISQKFIEAQTKATTCGWGRISNQGTRTNVLQYLNTTIMDNEECRQAHCISKRFLYIYDNVICTKNVKMKGTCNGDSGGALVVNEKLVGVVSWGVRCGIGLPDVFTRLSEHFEWIQEIISTKSTMN
ncbi:chymotrypsin-2-like [Culicoides brevitarsis]|uniref:chymotrypsin-2-like n=1 Tax=Culicoides brevitarsis TaxID=469753 RepID=UPI00307C3894